MKNIKSLSLLLIALTMLVASCRKEDNPNLPDLERVPIPLMKVVDNSDVLIQDPAAFKGKFTIDLLFKEDVAPKQIDIVIARNGDYTATKVLQAAVASFPTTIDLDAAKIATLFGIDQSKIVPGDFFEVGANIVTQSGMTIPAFSDIANQFSADVANFPGSSLSLKYPVVCPLVLDKFVGEYNLTDPSFWQDTYPVKISREGDNILVITGFVQDPESIIKLTINPQTTKVTVPSQIFGQDFGTGEANFKASGTGTIDACANSITVNLAFTSDVSNYGSSVITIKKK